MNNSIQRLIDEIKNFGFEVPSPASPEDIDRAKAANFPDELINFFTILEPKECIEFRQRIWSIEKSLEENDDATPGYAVYPHGYVVFASTISGDAYCFDTNRKNDSGEHPIVLFYPGNVEEEDSFEQINECKVPITDSFNEFLEHFANRTLPEG